MLQASWNSTDQRVQAWLRSRAPRLLAALTPKLNSLMLRLQAHIVGDKLSGQVLQHRTGVLAGSIRVIPARIEGMVLSGGVTGGGGPAFYGKFHEFGTTRAYQILPKDKKALAFTIGGQTVIRRSVLHPPIQERSFMRSALADMREMIIGELRASIHEGLQ